jgi:hypothetical protein
MTPDERQLVADLFARLADLERQPRDPEAERLMREGLARAPNAIYSLVQTVLVQDEALMTANDHIAQLEEAVKQAEEAARQRGSGANKWNTGSVLRGAGSVPSVGSREEPMGVPPGYDRGGAGYRDDAPPPGYGAPQGGGYGAPPGYGAPQGGGYGAPPGYGAPQGGGGGGFLGTAAAIAAGAIGSGLLLSGIRSALGGQSQGHEKGPLSGALDHLTGNKAENTGGNAGSGDLARDAGVNDIGRSGTFGAADLGDKGQFDSDDDDLDDGSAEEEEDFSDDAFDDDDT